MDKIGSIKKEITHRKWQEMYESYISSGKNVTEWCVENGISKKTFYYRLRQIRKDVIETDESHDIVPITTVMEQTRIADTSIKIKCSGISIELPMEISPEILSAAISGLRSC